MARKRIVLLLLVIVAFIIALYALLKGPSNEERQALTEQLFVSTREGDFTGIEERITEYKAVINNRTDNWTALDIAIMYGYYDLALLLYENGGTTSDSILLFATSFVGYGHHSDAVEINPLIKSFYSKIVQDNKKNINEQDENGNTALHIAVREGEKEIVDLLLSNQADVTIKNNEEESPFQVAVKHGYEDIAIKLYDKNEMFLEAVDVNGNNILHLAVSNGKREIYDYILSVYPQSLNQTNKDGKTPLSLAADYGDEKSVQYLLQKGADKTIKSIEGLFPIDYAMKWGHNTIISLLR